jgi:histone deacetylase complex subunit SAP18
MGLESKIVEEIPREKEPPVDREKTCPLLLRVFCSYNGRHNNKNDYGPRNTPPNELQIYTWMDATLKEITNLITEVNPEAKKKGTFFNFCVCFPSSNSPGYRMREIGSTTAGKKGSDDNATLSSKRFVIGDYLDVAITYARSGGASASVDFRDSRSRRMRPY